MLRKLMEGAIFLALIAAFSGCGPSKEEYQKLSDDKAEIEKQLDSARKESEAAKQETDKLKKEVDEKSSEVAVLTGKVKHLSEKSEICSQENIQISSWYAGRVDKSRLIQEGDLRNPKEFYIVARTGLPLYKSADPGSESTEKLPYGDRVTLAKGKQPDATVSVDGVNGQFRQVQSQEKSGFVFDAYLSRLPSPFGFENFQTYADRLFGASGAPRAIKAANGHEGKNLLQQDFRARVQFTETQDGGIKTISLRLPHLTLLEGYHLLAAFYPGLPIPTDEEMEFPYEGKTWTLKANDSTIEYICKDQANDSFRIVKEGANLTISRQSAE